MNSGIFLFNQQNYGWSRMWFNFHLQICLWKYFLHISYICYTFSSWHNTEVTPYITKCLPITPTNQSVFRNLTWAIPKRIPQGFSETVSLKQHISIDDTDMRHLELFCHERIFSSWLYLHIKKITISYTNRNLGPPNKQFIDKNISQTRNSKSVSSLNAFDPSVFRRSLYQSLVWLVMKLICEMR